MAAFSACSQSRQSGGMGGVSPILISEILAYLTLAGIDSRAERHKYLRTIQQLDNVYLADVAEKLKQKNKKP